MALESQIFDTIPDWKEGLDMVISKAEQARLDSLAKESEYGGYLFRANYILIDSAGNIVEESFFEPLVEMNGSIEIRKKNGKKKSEQLLLENTYDTKIYFENGNLEYEEIHYSDKNYGNVIRKKYYDNKWNSIEQINFSQITNPESFEGIVIENWRVDEEYLINSIVVEQEGKNNKFYPIREMRFYPNGKIKEKGSFSKRRFFEFRNEESYNLWQKKGERYLNKYSTILSERVKVKNGKWEYFNEEGDLIKVEIYDDGKLIE